MEARVKPSAVYERLVDTGFFGGPERRSFISYAIERMERCIERSVPLVVIAPPGVGKTALAYSVGVAVALGYPYVLRVIHVLPLRSIVDDVFKRFAKGLGRCLTRCRVEDLNIVTRQYGLLHGSPYLQSTYVATTVDTYAFSLLKLPVKECMDIERHEDFYGHYELPRASVYSALNFMDEAHLMLEYSVEEGGGGAPSRGAKLIMTLVYHLGQVGTPLVVATATLPSKVVDLVSRIFKLYDVPLEVIDYKEFVRDRGPDEFYELETKKTFRPIGKGLEELGLERLLERVDEGKCVGRLCVFINTVESAMRLFDGLSRKAVLLHSRFTPSDKVRKLEAIAQSGVIVSTQVLEAGVDISFDVVITELAPISSLIQRLGRLARGSSREGSWLIFYDEQSLMGSFVYDPDITKRTKEVLDSAMERGCSIHWHLPYVFSDARHVGYAELIDRVWDRFEVVESLDVDIYKALVRLDIDSKTVLNYVKAVGSFVRDENSAPLYVGVPGEDYTSFRKEVAERLIPMGFSEALRYVKKLIEGGHEAHLVEIQGPVREGGLKVGLKRLGSHEVASKHFEEYLRVRFISGSALAFAIPEEFYEGGVYGRGVLWP
ncbi:MAG: CRISPR-associated helicase Cas3' [Candidatus Nezhaarchaeota archaeon]|nr:CRISPR-associated helicase Cas3' [Candidatus Nezhaarchaeota archaeon]